MVGFSLPPLESDESGLTDHLTFTRRHLLFRPLNEMMTQHSATWRGVFIHEMADLQDRDWIFPSCFQKAIRPSVVI